MAHEFPLNRFEAGKGLRGIHVSLIQEGKESYKFLDWRKSLELLKDLGDEIDEAFVEHLASYNPDNQAIAMFHDTKESKVTMAVYSLPEAVR